MINLDQEEIMSYKLINDQDVKYDNFENGISNEDESSDESNNNLPEVQPQKIQKRNNINIQFIESMQQYEEEAILFHPKI